MIARPARVRIRSRKPWVLDRRRLFGWNVRLLTRYSYDTTSAVAAPPAGGAARGSGRAGADAAPMDPGKLVTADGTRIPQQAPARRGRGRPGWQHGNRPQTPTSIAEESRLPTPGRTPTGQPPAGTLAPGRGAPRTTGTDAPGDVRRSLPGCGWCC